GATQCRDHPESTAGRHMGHDFLGRSQRTVGRRNDDASGASSSSLLPLLDPQSRVSGAHRLTNVRRSEFFGIYYARAARTARATPPSLPSPALLPFPLRHQSGAKTQRKPPKANVHGPAWRGSIL